MPVATSLRRHSWQIPCCYVQERAWRKENDSKGRQAMHAASNFSEGDAGNRRTRCSVVNLRIVKEFLRFPGKSWSKPGIISSKTANFRLNSANFHFNLANSRLKLTNSRLELATTPVLLSRSRLRE